MTRIIFPWNGEFKATYSKAIIEKTKDVVSVLYCISEVDIDFWEFKKKKISFIADAFPKL